MLDLSGCLPKNMNGIRTTHTCELCGFEPKTKNKYREKQDHLVMKHFKEKIDKIFPHCRPYTCPTDDCGFTGKDKQALLRHYTGKHGILEKYLREALAENGIHYLPGEHGSKRRCSVSLSSNGGNPKMLKHSPPTISPNLLDPKDLLPTTPLPMTPRPNTEELRKEVEALMASFQPQPIENHMVIRVPQMVNIPLPQTPVQRPQQQTSEDCTSVNGIMPVKTELPHQMNGSIKVELPQHPVGSMPIKIELPQHPAPLTPESAPPSPMSQDMMCNSHSDLMLPAVSSPLPSLIVSSSMPQVSLPSMMQHHISSVEDALLRASSPLSNYSQSISNINIPFELITSSNGLVTTTSTPSFIVSAISSPALYMSSGSIIENKEVMWGGGPAVVVEASDTIPITYIETADGSYAAMLDAIDYDLLVPSMNSVDPVRERQLDFCTF